MDAILDLDLLERFCSAAGPFWDGLNQACTKYAINTPERIAQFLAQVAHESAGFHYVRELASGEAYEGRADLGNTQPGDGVRFKGRGLIQITGRANYAKLSEAFGVDFVGKPELLEEKVYAALSAGWYWDLHGLNALADQADMDAFETITRKINGGLNGLASRVSWWDKAETCWPPTE